MSNGQSNPGGGAVAAISAFFTFLVRLILVLLLGIVIGGLVFLGISAGYQTIWLPVQENARQIASIEAGLEDALELMNDRIVGLQERLLVQETAGDAQRESLASLQNSLESIQEDLAAMQDTGGADVEQLEQLQTDLDALSDEIATAISRQNASLEALATQIAALEEGMSSGSALQIQLDLLQAIDHLERTRLALINDSLGRVNAEISSALTVMTRLENSFNGENLAEVRRIEDLLLRARANVNTSPVVAAEQITIALDGLLTLLNEAQVPVSAAEPLNPPPALDSGSSESETDASEAPAGTPAPVTPTPTSTP